MKQRIIRLLAVSVILAVLCVGLASCVASDPFDVYWHYLQEQEMSSSAYSPDQITTVGAVATTNEETGSKQIDWVAYAISGTYVYRLDLAMAHVSDEYEFTYQVIQTTATSVVLQATGSVSASEFDGEQLLTFSEYTGLTLNEYDTRMMSTALLKVLVGAMDTLLAKVNMSSDDFGFTAMSSDAAVDADQSQNVNLGGAFSAERWVYAGQMTLLGMGMVFLVLAILWAVLGIFKACLYHPAETTKKEAPETAAPVVPAAPQQPVATAADDGALLAVITAAVAAAMEEEGTTPSGFRVVSFKKTTRGPWNG
jgi:sodium pump decarboxylase gamma subunit